MTTDITDLIYTDHTTEELHAAIAERGKTQSAVDNCKTFCTPPGLKHMLLSAMEGTDIRWGHYTHDSATILHELENAGRTRVTGSRALA